MARNAYRVLIADDCADDVVLLKRAFQACQGVAFLEVLSTGQQVVDYFEGKGRYADRLTHPIPDVLILDLRMPAKSGFEVLEHIRQRGLPMPKRLVILTSLAQSADIRKCFELGAHFFARKEADFRPLVQRLDRSMLDTSIAPRADAAGL